MNPIFKFVLAIILLISLAELPYNLNFYLPCAAALGFAYLSYDYFKGNKNVWGVIFAFLAIIVQPVISVKGAEPGNMPFISS